MTTNPNPYNGLPPERFWRNAVAEADPTLRAGLYTKKFELSGTQDAIATAGSCFAQHIGKNLKARGFNVLDAEPAPKSLPVAQHMRFGYGIYSARYGNIYTVRQMVQLLEESHGDRTPHDLVWQSNDGRFFDALRPSVEPAGLDSPDEVLAHREYHLKRVQNVIQNMTVLVFTLGLTETWAHRSTGTIYPTAPGVIAGSYDPGIYEFKNFSYTEICDDLHKVIALLNYYRKNKPLKYVLTVSPVPLTATACDKHVLLATVYSKSVLRAAAGHIVDQYPNVDYFPSFEIISNPWSDQNYYMPNKRGVRPEGVERVMDLFFSEHPSHALDSAAIPTPDLDIKNISDIVKKSEILQDVICDEELLEAFGPA